MELVAQLEMHPGGVVAWIGVGLIAGWLAGLVMSGGGYGVIADIVLGLVGAFVGGIISSFFITGQAGFWTSIVIALIGACVLIGVVRIFTPGTTVRR